MPRPTHRYTYLAITFHWTMAALITVQLGWGWWMQRLPAGYAKFEAYQRHLELGFVILMLAVVRIAWRLRTPKPPYTEEVLELPGWHHVTARGSHLALYAMMVALPLTGWIALFAVSPAFPVAFFGFRAPVAPGLAELPITRADQLEELAQTVHVGLAWAMVVTIVLHVGGALVHHLIHRDPVLTRMAPILKELPEPGDEPTPEPDRA
jgi:cytochrome b561